jgi:hypothetical protein
VKYCTKYILITVHYGHTNYKNYEIEKEIKLGTFSIPLRPAAKLSLK